MRLVVAQKLGEEQEDVNISLKREHTGCQKCMKPFEIIYLQ